MIRWTQTGRTHPKVFRTVWVGCLESFTNRSVTNVKLSGVFESLCTACLLSCSLYFSIFAESSLKTLLFITKQPCMELLYSIVQMWSVIPMHKHTKSICSTQSFHCMHLCSGFRCVQIKLNTALKEPPSRCNNFQRGVTHVLVCNSKMNKEFCGTRKGWRYCSC